MRKRDANFRFACPAGLFVDIDLGLKGPGEAVPGPATSPVGIRAAPGFPIFLYCDYLNQNALHES